MKFFALFLALFAFSSLTLAAETAQSKVVLYHSPTCPHCKEVVRYLQSINKTLPMKDTQNATYRREFNAIGGRGVPALLVDGKLIVGSSNIIGYIKDHPEILR